jgi:hypothetical protein
LQRGSRLRQEFFERGTLRGGSDKLFDHAGQGIG